MEQPDSVSPPVDRLVMPPSVWYQEALLGKDCCNGPPNYRCEHCEPDGFCESCDSFEGRGIEQISEYASTCDECGELVHHDLQRIPPDSGDQLGYCWLCRPDLFEDESA